MRHFIMPILQARGAAVEYSRHGAGPDLVLLPSLLADRAHVPARVPRGASRGRRRSQGRAAVGRRPGVLPRTACLAPAQLDLTPGLGAIRNATLCLAGAEDLATPAPLVRALAEGIPGARFQQIEGCGHCPQIKNPAAFVAAVEAFLDA